MKRRKRNRRATAIRPGWENVCRSCDKPLGGTSPITVIDGYKFCERCCP